MSYLHLMRIRTKEYNSWNSMKGRCLNPNNVKYNEYGGKGIKVCKRWMLFKNFLSDMGLAPTTNHTLDRYPNNKGNYKPGNVRWATPIEQSNNTSRNVFFKYNGENKTVAGWERHFGFKTDFIRYRLRLGWSFEKAVTTPVLNKSDNLIPTNRKKDSNEVDKQIKQNPFGG